MLSLAVLAIYFCSCLWLFAAVWLGDPQRGAAHGKLVAGLATATLAVLLHAYLLYSTLFLGAELALNTPEAASLVGWIIAVISVWATWRRPRFAGLTGVLVLCVGLAAALTDDGSRNFVTAQSGWELAVHIVIAVVAYALIALGAVIALALSALDRRLRGHRPLGVLSKLPSVEALEAAMFQTISAGFALLTLTLFSGFFFVRDLVAQHLSHKVALSCVAWLILGTLLIGHWRLGWRGRLAARWTLGGFVLLGMAYFGSKFVLEIILGRHWG